MSYHHSKGNCTDVVSLLLLEGDTESIFYPLVRDKYLVGMRAVLRQVQCGGNTNKKMLAKIFQYVHEHPSERLRVYCCSDTDSNNNSPTPLDIGLIRKTVKERNMQCVLSVDKILADPEIESWFFYDIDGIYEFLRAKKSQRKPDSFKNPKNLGKRELQNLFEQFGSVYTPGERANNFVKNLDLNKIVNCCRELRMGIERIKARATDLRSNIFRPAEY